MTSPLFSLLLLTHHFSSIHGALVRSYQAGLNARDSEKEKETEKEKIEELPRIPMVGDIKMPRVSNSKAHIDISDTGKGMFILGKNFQYDDYVCIYTDEECTRIVGVLEANHSPIYVPNTRCWLLFKNVSSGRARSTLFSSPHIFLKLIFCFGILYSR